jgi:hypothetical protein
LSVLILRAYLLLRNSGDPSDQKTDFSAVDSGVVEIGENSKNVYQHDSYSLARTPLDVEPIIVMDNSNDTLPNPNFVRSLKNLVTIFYGT